MVPGGAGGHALRDPGAAEAFGEGGRGGRLPLRHHRHPGRRPGLRLAAERPLFDGQPAGRAAAAGARGESHDGAPTGCHRAEQGLSLPGARDAHGAQRWGA